jgi:hypothetical protein
MTMKYIAAIVLCIALVASLRAAEFQNLGFEDYPGGESLPNWRLLMWSGAGELLYNGEGRLVPVPTPGISGLYPFIGAHIGGGPILAVLPTPMLSNTPTPPEGDHAMYLWTFTGRDFPTAAQAQAYVDLVAYGGIAQTATVPSWAKSFWIASDNNSSPPVVSFSGHELTMGSAGGLNSQWRWRVGNIEPIAGLTRELVITGGPASYSPIGFPDDPLYYSTGAPLTIFDSIMFSPEPWDGPPINVPEPQSIALTASAIVMMVARRRANRR